MSTNGLRKEVRDPVDLAHTVNGGCLFTREFHFTQTRTDELLRDPVVRRIHFENWTGNWRERVQSGLEDSESLRSEEVNERETDSAEIPGAFDGEDDDDWEDDLNSSHVVREKPAAPDNLAEEDENQAIEEVPEKIEDMQDQRQKINRGHNPWFKRVFPWFERVIQKRKGRKKRKRVIGGRYEVEGRRF